MTTQSVNQINEEFQKYLASFGDPNDFEALRGIPLDKPVKIPQPPGLPPKHIDLTRVYAYARHNLPPPPSRKEIAVKWLQDHACAITSTAVAIIAAVGTTYVASSRYL